MMKHYMDFELARMEESRPKTRAQWQKDLDALVKSLGFSIFLEDFTRDPDEEFFLTANGAGIYPGLPVTGVQLRVVEIANYGAKNYFNMVSTGAGEIGEICILLRDVRESSMHTGRDIWRRTGEVGYFDSHKRLWLCGKISQRIACPERAYYPLQVEAAALTHAAVRRAALVGVPVQGRLRPVLVIEPSLATDRQRDSLIRTLGRHLRDRCFFIQDEHILAFCAGLPHDLYHDSSPGRIIIQDWAIRMLNGEVTSRPDRP